MPKKFSIGNLMNEHTKRESGGDDAFAFRVEFLDIGQIEPSKMNFYTVDDVAELKASIELVGLQQNLVVRERDDGKFELVAGERRYTVLSQLIAEGNEKYRRVPCKIEKTKNDIETELQLIFTNSTARQLTDYEQTHQAQRLKELLTDLKNSGYKFTGKKRDIVADLLNISASQVARYESINKNLSPEFINAYKNEELNITTAFELSRLPKKEQAEALEDHKGGVTLTPDNVRERREAVKKKPALPPKETSDPPTAAAPERDKTEPEAGQCKKCGEYCGFLFHSKKISKLSSCNDCGRQKGCEYAPKPGEWARINCPHWIRQKNNGSEADLWRLKSY